MKESKTNPGLSDTEVLRLFHEDAAGAWRLFIDRYADLMFAALRGMGFDYDQAMDRFVYICEKLCEDDFRRLKTVRYAGQRGDLTPWVRQVVKNLSVNWLWSVEGRRRLLKPIAQLPMNDQIVFELYFWKGLSPPEIYEELRVRRFPDLDPGGVYDALERIFAQLSQKKLWRLMSNMARRRRVVSLDETDEEAGLRIDPPDLRANPENTLVQKEAEERLVGARAALSPREQLVIQLRFEECLAFKAIADILRLEEYVVKTMLKDILDKLRQAFG